MTIAELEPILLPKALSRVAWCCFDDAWYIQAYPGVLNEIDASDFDTLRRHYVELGRGRGYAPNMYFDELWYQRRYRDVGEEVAAGLVGSGYEHYCAIGYLNRSPHWLYDDEVYAGASPDLTDEALVDLACFNRYDHYLKIGAPNRRVAHLLFDPLLYREHVAAAQGDTASLDRDGAFAHFLASIWLDRRDAATSIYFDQCWYLERYDAARTAIDTGMATCALQHYLVGGISIERIAAERISRDPRAEFSEEFYLDRYPDVAAAVREGVFHSGYEHFLKSGVFDLRMPSAQIDLRQYLQSHAEARAGIERGLCRDAFEHILRAGSLSPDVPEAPADTTAIPAMVTQTPPRADNWGTGRIDFLGYHAPAHGWFFCGWVAPEHPDLERSVEGIAYFELGQMAGTLLVSTYFRPDLGGNGCGVVIYLDGSDRNLGRLVSLNIVAAGRSWTAYPSDGAPALRDGELMATLRPVLGQLAPNAAKGILVGLAARHGYTGANTLGGLRDRVMLELDEVIFCPPHGLMLIGWLLAHPGVVVAMRLHCGSRMQPMQPAQFAWIDRPDVLQSVGQQFGFQNLQNGFITYVPGIFTAGESTYIEIETAAGEIAYRGIPEPRLRGMDAMRFVLDRVDARHEELVRLFDTILGPALTSLNRARLAESEGHQVINFGTPVAAPELSIIVPLYGRLDFMEYQFALASRDGADEARGIAHEYIYVLDDPRQQRQAEQLAASIFARFAIPFRLVVVRYNLGFAPANNLGLKLARGRYVAFLNSDVFTDSTDWMERLVARLAADPTLGAIGPLLLFEDGSVQHMGMVFEPLSAFGNWQFPMHERKGWRPPSEAEIARGDIATDGVRRCKAITGACIVLERALAEALGGFDTDYIIGDFEDADLCMKLAERGLGCGVDLQVRMYHLERQSQAGSEQRWRMNLTLHNAWVHETRWGARLRMPAVEEPGPVVPLADTRAPAPVAAAGKHAGASRARTPRIKPSHAKAPA